MARLAANPVLTFLGRRGRGAIVEALRRQPGPWSVRALAAAADVNVMTASRAAAELAALGAVEVLRPGRESRITWRPSSPVAAFLSSLEPPSPAVDVPRSFAAAFAEPGDVLVWHHPEDVVGDPHTPVRIAVVSDDEDAALDAVEVALDALAAAGWPAPRVDVFDRASLVAGDAIAHAVLNGRPVDASDPGR